MGIRQLEFRCIGMKDGERFPLENTGRGRDISPKFIIDNLSLQAKSLIITLEDVSHPIKNFTHWVIWNIPAMDNIPAAIASGKVVTDLNGALQGIAYGIHRYAGPKPPKGTSHKYRFSIYALDEKLTSALFQQRKEYLAKQNLTFFSKEVFMDILSRQHYIILRFNIALIFYSSKQE